LKLKNNMNKNETEFYYKGKYEGEFKIKQLYKKLFYGLLIVCLALLAMSWIASLVENSNTKIINQNDNTQNLKTTN